MRVVSLNSSAKNANGEKKISEVISKNLRVVSLWSTDEWRRLEYWTMIVLKSQILLIEMRKWRKWISEDG